MINNKARGPAHKAINILCFLLSCLFVFLCSLELSLKAALSDQEADTSDQEVNEPRLLFFSLLQLWLLEGGQII